MFSRTGEVGKMRGMFFWQDWRMELQLSGFIWVNMLSRDTSYPGWGRSAGPRESDTLPPCSRDGSPVFTPPGGDWSLQERSRRSPACSRQLHLSLFPFPRHTPLPARCSGERQGRQSPHSSCCDLPVSCRECRLLREPLSHTEPTATALPEPVLKASKNNPRSISDSSV